MIHITLCDQVLSLPPNGLSPAALSNAVARERQLVLETLPVLTALHTLRPDCLVLPHRHGLLVRHRLVPSGQLQLDLLDSRKRRAASLPRFEQDVALIRKSLLTLQQRLDRAAPALRRELVDQKALLTQLEDLMPLLRRPGTNRAFFPDDDSFTLSVPTFAMEVVDERVRRLSFIVLELRHEQARILNLEAEDMRREMLRPGRLVLRPQNARFSPHQMIKLSQALCDAKIREYQGLLLRHAPTNAVIGAQLLA